MPLKICFRVFGSTKPLNPNSAPKCGVAYLPGAIIGWSCPISVGVRMCQTSPLLQKGGVMQWDCFLFWMYVLVIFNEKCIGTRRLHRRVEILSVEASPRSLPNRLFASDSTWYCRRRAWQEPSFVVLKHRI